MIGHVVLVFLACSGKNADTADGRSGQSGQASGPLRRVAVSETAKGKVVITDGTGGNVGGEICLSELHPDTCQSNDDLVNPCLMFGTHMQDDGRMLLTYTLRDPDKPYAPSAITLLEPAHPPIKTWTISELAIPAALQEQEQLDCANNPLSPNCSLNAAHSAWLLDEETLLVADTSNHRILWLKPPRDGETAPVTHILSTQNPQWIDERNPNQVQRLDIDGNPHILITFKSHQTEAGEQIDEGRLVMWDISEPDSPQRVWTFPSEGGLAAVHQGWVQETPAGTMLLYAHSAGAQNSELDNQYGSLGFAAFNGVAPPQYMADGLLAGAGIGFTRDVEWDPDSNALLVVDSGCENIQDRCGRSGEILAFDFPELQISGKSGAYAANHAEQHFIELNLQNTLVKRQLRFPFEVDPLQPGDWVKLGTCAP